MRVISREVSDKTKSGRCKSEWKLCFLPRQVVDKFFFQTAGFVKDFFSLFLRGSGVIFFLHFRSVVINKIRHTYKKKKKRVMGENHQII